MAGNDRYAGEMMAKGKVGERAVAAWLASRGYSIENVTDDAAQQDREVDLVATRGGVVVTVEVKTWKGAGPRLLWEYQRLNHKARDPRHCTRLGWSGRSEADVLFFVNVVRKQAFALRFDEYRRGFQTWVGERAEADMNVPAATVHTDRVKTTLFAEIDARYFPSLRVIDLSAWLSGPPQAD